MAVDPLAFMKGFQGAQQIQDNALQNRLLQTKLAGFEREQEQTNALNDLYRAAVKPDGTIDRSALISGAASRGLGAQIPDIQTSFAKQDTAQAQLRKAQIENAAKELEALGNLAGTVTDQASYDRALQIARGRGLDVSQFDPVYNPQYVAQFANAALSRKDQLTQELDRMKFDETRRHNKASEQNQATGHAVALRGQDLTAETARRGQDLTNQRAVETGQIARDNKANEALDKKVTAFSTQLDKTNIPQFESLLSDIEADIARFQKGDIPGYGPVSGNLPQFMLTREGQMLRQKIAQLQNLTLKDRSGAAVTNQELQRLLNEIGTGVFSTDDQLRSGLANVRRNLDAVKRNVVAGVDEATLREYQARGGLPLTRGEPPKGASTSTTSETRKVVRTGTFNGRKVVQYSDGTVEYQ